MRNLDYLNKYRIQHPAGYGDSYNGAFKIFIGGRSFYVVASNGGDWEHVSVSLKNQKRTPTWEEMCNVKNMFFEEDEVVVQFHPGKDEYVNIHEFCLHLWKPRFIDIPTPPTEFV